MVRVRDKSIFVVGFWWLWDILTTSLTNFVYPKPLTILALICLDHLSSTEAHDHTTNPSTFSTHHSHPANDQHNVQVPDSSKHAIHR
jgi:hypothetical protein